MPEAVPSLAPEKAEGAKDESPKGAEGKDAAPKEGAEKKEGVEPGPDHPRFKEVYWKMKKHEREAEESRKDMDALRAHNAQIAAALDDLKKNQARVPDEPEPDPAADPEAYKAWSRHQIEKVRREESEARKTDRIATLIEIEAGLHDDYVKVVAIAEREMVGNPALKEKVWGESNPARAAYKLGRKIMDEAAAKDKDEIERQERLDAGAVEKPGAEGTPTPKEPDLTDDEKRVVKGLFRDMPFPEAVKKYKAQKAAMGRMK